MPACVWVFNAVSPEDMCSVCKGKKIDETQIQQAFEGVSNNLRLLKGKGWVSLQEDFFVMRVSPMDSGAVCLRCGRQQYRASLMIFVSCNDKENISKALAFFSQ